MVEDRFLVRRLNRRDAAALSRVYEKYRDDLLRLVADRHLPNRLPACYGKARVLR